MKQYYAGIGSTIAPQDVIYTMIYIGRCLGEQSYVLRSGGADGCDLAFEKGCDVVLGEKQIYLPFKEFNGNRSNLVLDNLAEKDVAYDSVSKFHPRFDLLNEKTVKFHARNYFQIKGHDKSEPCVSFVVCWTPEGKLKGGTSQAIRIAKSMDIPVYNLYRKKEKEAILRICENNNLDKFF